MQVNTEGTIYFAVDGTTQETSMEQTKRDSKNPELHNPFLSQANEISFCRRIWIHPDQPIADIQ